MLKRVLDKLTSIFRTKYEPLPPEATSWSWVEGKVDRSKRHFKLVYGDIEQDTDKWVDIAYVDYPLDGNFTVEFILRDPKNQQESVMIDEAKWQLDYHIVERALSYPARYMEAYCGMTANFYAVIHWGIYNSKKR